jgi:hypothetical protein
MPSAGVWKSECTDEDPGPEEAARHCMLHTILVMVAWVTALPELTAVDVTIGEARRGDRIKFAT